MPEVLRTPEGKAVVVADDEVETRLRQGFTRESSAQAADRSVEAQIRAESTTSSAKLRAGVEGALRGATLGLSDVVSRAAGGEESARRSRQVREANPTISTVTEIAGGVAPALASGGTSTLGAAARLTPAGATARLGAGLARAAPEAGALAKVGRAAVGGAVEGAITGIGTGVSDLALSEDPLSVERAVSTLSSRALYGGAIGGGAGTLGKSAEIGLAKARRALDDVASANSQRLAIGEDLANLDAKGLAAAERAELDAIETARVPRRAELADELAAFRRELKAQKQLLVTKDVNLPAAGDRLSTRELGRISLKANRQLDNLLDNPAGLAKNPAKALDALQRQEHALAKIAERTEDLRTAFAADKTTVRAAALDTIAPALERNRALQAQITELTAAPASQRLEQIAEAKLALSAGGGKKTLAEQMAGSTVFSVVTGAVAGLPVPGSSLLAPMLGARAADVVGERVFGRLGRAMAEGQARSAKAIGAIFERGERAVRAAPPVATRVLAGVAFGPLLDEEPRSPTTRKLPEVFRQRADELREQVAAGPDGKPVMRPAARARIGAALAPIAAAQPMLADRMETLAARRVEFLASKLPRRPEIGAIQIGPDRWQPSDMEMRGWARYVAAVEDPDGILERVAQGAVTPEDAEVMREVYPELLADITRQILERLPTLRQNLPYHRRLALSILTGVAVDPSMEPRILAALQAQYAAEPAPPTPQPQFGSVKSTETGTASQRREQRM
jgi:hypothetical protein